MPLLLGGLSGLAEQCGLTVATLTRASGVMYVAVLQKEGSEESLESMDKFLNTVSFLNLVHDMNAHAMLEWCPTEVKRAAGDVWGPPRQDFALMQRVKDVFDPQNVLSPSRFAGEI
jgi:FAD/FMN-containing dehydrogenase